MLDTTERIYAPRIRYFDHAPRIRISEVGDRAGCSCGWRSHKPSKDAISSWWRHATDAYNDRPPR